MNIPFIDNTLKCIPYCTVTDLYDVVRQLEPYPRKLFDIVSDDFHKGSIDTAIDEYELGRRLFKAVKKAINRLNEALCDADDMQKDQFVLLCDFEKISAALDVSLYVCGHLIEEKLLDEKYKCKIEAIINDSLNKKILMCLNNAYKDLMYTEIAEQCGLLHDEVLNALNVLETNKIVYKRLVGTHYWYSFTDEFLKFISNHKEFFDFFN